MKNFIFHIHKLGSSLQDFLDNNDESMKIKVNHPMIDVDGKVKKWGDEYIIIQNPSTKFLNNPSGIKFIGRFDFDKNIRKYLKLFKEIDIPMDKEPDYYITTVNIKSQHKINKSYNLKRCSKNYSCILSCAYHYQNEKQMFVNELLIICQPNDIIKIDNIPFRFDKDTLSFVND